MDHFEVLENPNDPYIMKVYEPLVKERRAVLKHRIRSMLGEWERPFKPDDLDKIRRT